MSRQYLRKLSLVVASESEALDLSELHVRFEVRQADVQTPNNAFIRIYNLSDNTARKVEKEFSRVVLQAGYRDDPFGTIFDGQLVQVKRGRENAVSDYIDLIAADASLGYIHSVVNTSLGQGSSARDRLDILTRAMEAQGVKPGYSPDDLPPWTLPRGRVFFGEARHHLRTLGATTGASWSIQNGRLQFVPDGGYIPGDAVVLTSATGLIGLPEQTADGIKARCLINPNIVVGGRVQIDNASIQRANVQFKPATAVENAPERLPRVVDDGFYRVLAVDYVGDTHATEWYADLICVAMDDNASPSQARLGRN